MLWCDLPGPGRDQPRVVERVDDLRALARLVVDLLVRARGEEAREGVDDGEEAVACEAGRGGDHVLLGDAALEEAVGMGVLEAADAAVGGEVGVEHDELGLALGELDAAPRRTRRRRTRRVTFGARARSPDSGSPSSEAATLAPSSGGTGSSRGLQAERASRSSIRATSSAWARAKASSSGRARVPAVGAAALLERARVLHEGDALALDRLRHERLGHVRRRPSSNDGERLAQRRVVVPVAGGDVPAERAQLRLEVAEREDLLGRSCRTGARSGRRSPTAGRAAGAPRDCSASQFWPSCSSPSPVITTTRPPRPRWRFAHAMPRPFEIPIPSEPEFASIPGTPTSGWPSRPPSRRSRSSRSAGSTPSAWSAA